MSDISLTSACVIPDEKLSLSPPPVASKQKTDEHEHTSTSNKKLRLDTELSDNPIQASSSMLSEKNESENPALPMSPQSEQTASTSSGSGTDWTTIFKENQIPVPYNEFQNPRQLLGHLIPNLDVNKLPSTLDDFDICRVVFQLFNSNGMPHPHISDLFLVQREKLKEYNTIEQCVDLIDRSENIIVLTGAGCSVSCGIPDFRSRDGVYARLRVDFPDLPDPQAMFDIFYFDHDPRPFFKFAKEIYPGQFKPSLSHMFIRKLEQNRKLLRNYTQNIDTLEMAAEIKKVIQCHGSFATATCTTCKYQVDAEHIREKIFNQEIPYCEKCQVNKITDEQSSSNPSLEENDLQPKPEEKTNEEQEDPQLAESSQKEGMVYKKNNSAGILKPDIVFFGEGLPELYHQSIGEDKSKCDLLIVIGSSLKVKPVANIPHLLPQNIPQILINRESLKHLNFDIELLGDCDVIVNELLLRLEEKQRAKSAMPDASLPSGHVTWSDLCKTSNLLREIADEEAESLLFPKKSSEDLQSECGSSGSLDNSTVVFGDVNTKEVEEQSKISTEIQKQQETAEDKAPEEQEQETTTALETKTDEMMLHNKKYTKDYLKESSFLYLKPNMYIFHGAEVQLRYTRKKLLKLKKKYAENGDVAKNGLSDEDDDDSDESSDMTDSDDSDDSDDEDDEVSETEQEVNEESKGDNDQEKGTEQMTVEKEAVTAAEATIAEDEVVVKKNKEDDAADKEGDEEDEEDDDFDIEDDEDEDEEDDDDDDDDDEMEDDNDEVTGHKKTLANFLNESMEDEEDDEDFMPEVNMNKKQLEKYANGK